MACSCKQSVKLEEKYGVDEEETLFEKTRRFLLKTVVFIITLLLGIVLTPVLIIVVIYKLFFGGYRGIVLPKFLGKYLEKDYGEELQNTY